jgi:UDP-glucose 4-epimerase
MRVMVTGGMGFVGLTLIRQLLAGGHEGVIFDMLPSLPKDASDLAGKVKVIMGNMLELPTLMEVVQKEKVETIVHLAALRNNDSQANPYAAFRVNVEGTVNILETARMTAMRRVVYASSVAVNGSPEYYEGLGLNISRLHEEAPTRPNNVYGATKVFNEEMGRQYHMRYGVDSIGVRLAILYGPGKKGGSKTSEFNDLVEGPAQGKPVSISTYGDQPITLQYIKDAAHALFCACFAEAPKHRVFNTGSAVTTVRAFVQEVRRIIPGAQISLSETTKRRSVASGVTMELAKEELGYIPQYDLAAGIRDHLNGIGYKNG